jgi:hypothetical protein
VQEVSQEEQELAIRETEYDRQNAMVAADNDRMHAEMDKVAIERDLFEREAAKLKAEAERDQADSEKVGFFKANKDRLRDDLRILREELENEREALREDRIRLDMHKNELKTR